MYTELEKGLGYTFRDQKLLENALTHSSYANERRDGRSSNERLEFLGDSILGFVVAEFLYRGNPDKPEGDLTRIRADLVCERNLAKAAGTIRLGEFLLLGHGEDNGGGRHRDSIVSDAMDSECFPQLEQALMGLPYSSAALLQAIRPLLPEEAGELGYEMDGQMGRDLCSLLEGEDF